MMYIDYEKIGKKLGVGREFFYKMKIASNCAYIKKNIKKVKKRLKGKTPIIAAFYVYDDTKWKCQSVYDLMEKDERFEPYIFVTKNAAPENNCNYQTDEDFNKVYVFFKNKDMRVLKAFDTAKGRYIPFEEMSPKPDIIIYQHPWYVETSQGPVVCSKFALTYYIPYYISDTNEWFEYQLRFHRYIYKYFIPTENIKSSYAKHMPDKGQKLIVTGHPQLDYYYLNPKQPENKYIIYAPHWTVCGNNIRYGTFDWNGWEILEYAEKHPELNWIFKPHPLLYKFLFTSGYMEKDRIDEYYNRWQKVGILYDKGDYLKLFLNSKLMITDSGSFLIEYFATVKPCIHLVSDKFKGNDLAKTICKTYYEAKNLDQLKKWLDLLINKSQDTKKQEREILINKLNLNNNYAAQNIFDEIIKDL